MDKSQVLEPLHRISSISRSHSSSEPATLGILPKYSVCNAFGGFVGSTLFRLTWPWESAFLRPDTRFPQTGHSHEVLQFQAIYFTVPGWLMSLCVRPTLAVSQIAILRLSQYILHVNNVDL